MNAIVSKFNLKHKFIIIFLIFSLFSIYQIFSDTISNYYHEEMEHNKRIENLSFIQEMLFFTVHIQQSRLDISLSKQHNRKKETIVQKEQYLLEEINALRKHYYDNTHFIEESSLWLTLFNQSEYAFKLLNERVGLMINRHTNHMKPQSQKEHTALDLLCNEIPFILQHLNDELLLQADVIKHFKHINAKLKTLEVNKESIKTLEQQLNKLQDAYTTNQTPMKIHEQSTQLISGYNQLNQELYELLKASFIQDKKKNDFNFNLKLAIEIIAVVIAILLLYFLYKSLFIYIKKIQYAHRIKSIFLSNMSHELRTPLNAIIGFLNILKESKDEKEREKFVDIIYKSSKQLLYIINDILDFSKIEDAKLKIEKKPFNIVKELELLIELFSANASSKNITLETQFDEKIPSCIISDKFRLKQIVSNLISNAIKFTSEGGVIKLIVQVKKNKYLYICVEDNGIGISRKAQKNIFKSFLQAKSSTSREYGGTGLGLSISSKLVSLLGSKLKVASKEYVGSRFYFNLKIKKCKEAQKSLKVQETNSTYNGKVLLVEDNPTNQFLMQITFSNLKLDVVLANDGVEAVEKFKRENFDIIFMDDNMPNKSGVEAAQEIIAYEMEHEKVHTPIIALTANTGSDMKKRLLQAGMDEYMSKPFDIKLLHQILQKYLC